MGWAIIAALAYGAGIAWLATRAPVGEQIDGRGFVALAHCPSCDLYLLPEQGCLHLQPVNDAGAQSTIALSFAPVPFHSTGDSL